MLRTSIILEYFLLELIKNRNNLRLDQILKNYLELVTKIQERLHNLNNKKEALLIMREKEIFLIKELS